MRAPQYGQSPFSVNTLKQKGYRLKKSKMKHTDGGLRFNHYELKRPDGTIAYVGGDQQEFFAIVKAELKKFAKDRK